MSIPAGFSAPPLRVRLQAHPGARHERVELLPDGSLVVWVRARPVEGQANAAVEEAVARAAGLRRRQVRLVAGQASRTKLAEVELPDLEALRARLVARPVPSK